MPALNNNTLYCHLVDREDSDNLVVPGTLTVGGVEVTGGGGGAGFEEEPLLGGALVATSNEVGIYVLEEGGADYVGVTDGLISAVSLGTGGGNVTLQAGDTALNMTHTNGNVAITCTQLGFFDEAGTTRPVVPLTTPSVQNVIDALVALGLVSQSD